MTSTDFILFLRFYVDILRFKEIKILRKKHLSIVNKI